MSPSSPSDPLSNRTFLQYRILEKLGAGGMGEIYKARDTRLNRFVAIKMLPDHMSADPERRRRFIQEAQAASALNHPNIITIYDIVYDDDKHYMVVEYIDGKTLVELIPKDGLRVPLAIQYASQIADALTSAHAAGIVHRDLKPANVMVSGSGLVKLLDFGLAKILEPVLDQHADQHDTIAPDGTTKTMLTAAMTVEGTLMGTVNYMSPEQAEGKRVDARSDIFAFGAVLYEMLTGRCAFQGDSTVATLSAVLRDDVRPISELAPDVPAVLEQIVLRCLKKDPAQRFQSMQELQSVLAPLKHQSASGALYGRAVPVAIPTQPRRSGARRFGWILGMALLLAAGGFWWTTQQAKVSPPPGAPPTPSKSASSDLPTGGTDTSPAVATNSQETQAPEPKAPTSVTLNDGLPVSLVLAADIPANAGAGDQVRFEVGADVRLLGTVVIRKGAAATGVIVGGARKLPMVGRRMSFRLETVALADGETMSLRATPVRPSSGVSKQDVDNGGKKSKDAAATAGNTYKGYIDGSRTMSEVPN